MANRFWVLGTGTWDNSLSINWATTSGGAPGAAAPVAGDVVTFDGNSGGGTITVNANLAMSSLTMGAFTGTLDFSANNNNITLSTLSVTGTGTRTLNMGNGTWTVTGTTGFVTDFSTVTNLTLNANSSTLLLQRTPSGSTTFSLGNKSYNVIQINDAISGGVIEVLLAGGPTIATLTLTSAPFLRFQAGVTTTITNAFSNNGTSATQVYFGSSNNSTATLSVGGACTLTWVMVTNITKAGAGSITATNAFNGGNNSGVTITSPAGGGHIIGG